MNLVDAFVWVVVVVAHNDNLERVILNSDGIGDKSDVLRRSVTFSKDTLN